MTLRDAFPVMTDAEFAAAVRGVQKQNHWWPFSMEVQTMPCPSRLHDPLAKIFWPNAPLVPQLKSAAERDCEDAKRGIEGWSPLLTAAAAEIERLQTAIDAAERLDDGQELSLAQPHPRIVSIVAGNRMTMRRQQEEIKQLSSENDELRSSIGRYEINMQNRRDAGL